MARPRRPSCPAACCCPPPLVHANVRPPRPLQPSKLPWSSTLVLCCPLLPCATLLPTLCSRTFGTDRRRASVLVAVDGRGRGRRGGRARMGVAGDLEEGRTGSDASSRRAVAEHERRFEELEPECSTSLFSTLRVDRVVQLSTQWPLRAREVLERGRYPGRIVSLLDDSM